MSLAKEFLDGEYRRCAHNYHPLPVVLTRGEGVWLWDVEGNRYLDMMSAYSAVSHGHKHPKLVAAINEQMDRLCVTSRAFHTDQLYPFLEKLCSMSQMDMALPMNTGAEAVETAIKAVRRWGYQVKKIPQDKAEIIVAHNNFHGRTLTITSFSSEESYKTDYGPFTPGFTSIPYGDSLALQDAINANTCAFLVEPIQGEAGINIPFQGWLTEISQLCKENNVLLILDEIQSGLGRTGKLFAFQHENIMPDGLILGKALGGGIYPVSCFLASREIMEVFTPGSHGSTFGGNPLACAIAKTALEILETDGLIENSKKLGAYLLNELKKIASPFVKEVRGKGLWIGMEMERQKISARKVCESLLTNGVLTKEAHDTVIRIAPPLIITQEECDWALSRIHKAFQEL